MKGRLILIFFLTSLMACQEEDSFIVNREDVIDNYEEYIWREKQNRWIFSQMREHYFWTEQLKDSLDYDYTLLPDLFFKSMLVEEDRFSYCFLNEDYNGRTKSFDLNESVSVDTVFICKEHRIGYFRYDGFEAEADITDIIFRLKVQDISDLIIDLRNNPGGLVKTAVHLASFISRNTLGKQFCRLRYNKNISEKMLQETGSRYSYYYFLDDFNHTNCNLNLTRIFFIVNYYSASSSELIINCLKPYIEVVTIGETTRGKDVGMYCISNPEYKYALEPITFRSYNALGDSVPKTGIIPDILVRNDLSLIDPAMDESSINAAVTYIMNN